MKGQNLYSEWKCINFYKIPVMCEVPFAKVSQLLEKREVTTASYYRISILRKCFLLTGFKPNGYFYCYLYTSFSVRSNNKYKGQK